MTKDSNEPAVRKRGYRGPLRRRWFGFRGGWLVGAVAAPESPGVLFHVRLVEEDGPTGVAVLADEPDSGRDLPAGHGFRIPPPLDWFRRRNRDIRFQFEVVETGVRFPIRGVRLSVEWLQNEIQAPGTAAGSEVASLIEYLHGPMDREDSEQRAARCLEQLQHAIEVFGTPRGRPLLVLAVHELTRTGAPLIALHLAGQLRQRHGFRVLILNSRGSGDLHRDFECAGHMVVNDLEIALYWREVATIERLSRLCRLAGGHPALVNSLCAIPLAAALKKTGWRVLSLVHEFPDNFHAAHVQTFFRSCDEVVFPSEVVRRSFAPWLQKDSAGGAPDGSPGFSLDDPPLNDVMPQGCHMLDQPPPDPELIAGLHEQWRGELGLKEGDRVVLSCGTRDGRKGFDWWSELLAHYHSHSANGRRVAFVWIGGITEMRLHQETVQKLQALEPRPRFLLLPPIPDPRPAYLFADAFLMCSRLDPFPNVVLEAILHGLPVVGFDRGQGIAATVQNSGMGRVVPCQDLEAVTRALDEVLWDAELTTDFRGRGPDWIRLHHTYQGYGDTIAGKIGNVGSVNPQTRSGTGAMVLKTAPVMALGFHRTGTSLVSSWLGSLGINMSPSGRQRAANGENPQEYHEDPGFLDFHTGALQLVHGDFMNHWGGRLSVFLPDYHDDWTGFTDRASDLLASIDTSKPWGWKDPRTLLFLPLWRRLFPDAPAIVCVRHPLEILWSIVRRGTDPLALVEPGRVMEAYVGYHRPLIQQLAESHSGKARPWFFMRTPADRISLGRLHAWLTTRIALPRPPLGNSFQLIDSAFPRLRAGVVDGLNEAAQAGFDAVFPQAAAVERLLRRLALDQESGGRGSLTDLVDPVDVETALGRGPQKADGPGSKDSAFHWLHRTLADLSGGNFDLYRELHARLSELVARKGA